MGIVDYSKLPLIDSFDKLERNTPVYSDKYGSGEVLWHYKEDIVIAFSTFRKRFSPDDHDLREIPKSWVEKKRKKIEVEVRGHKMSFSAFKTMRELEKELNFYIKRTKEIEESNPNDPSLPYRKQQIKKAGDILNEIGDGPGISQHNSPKHTHPHPS